MKHSCVACDGPNGMTPFSNETMIISYGARSTKVPGLSGWRCSYCSEVEFDQESASRYAAAGDELVMQVPLTGAGLHATSTRLHRKKQL